MKNIIHLVMACILAFSVLTSCKKNKDELNVVGKWYFVKAEYNNRRNSQDDRSGEEFSGGEFLQLNADGSLIEGEPDDPSIGRWKKTGENLAFITMSMETGISRF